MALSGKDKQTSWLDEYTHTKTKPFEELEAVESSFYQFCLVKEGVKVTPAHLKTKKENSVCVCPSDVQSECLFKQNGFCVNGKHFAGYFATGRKVPNSYPKNKFIVLKSHKTYPSRFVQDHLFVKKPFYNYFKRI